MLILKFCRLILMLCAATIMLWWVWLTHLIVSGGVPKMSEPTTGHIFPFKCHGTTFYLSDLQDCLHRWSFLVFFGILLLLFALNILIGFISKKKHEN